MFNLNNYRMVPENTLQVYGTEFAVKDITTGAVYVSNKAYTNKLFDEMGYRNLTVIKILKEFAGKIITDIGNLTKSKIYVNDTDHSFCVANPEAFVNLENLGATLTASGFTKVAERTNPSVYNQEVIVQSPSGIYFSIKANLADENVEILSLHINEMGITDGMLYEGDFNLIEYGVVNSAMITLNSPVDASATVHPDEVVSLHEYVELLKGLGLAKLNRRTNIVHLTEEGMAIAESAIGADVEPAVSDYNAKSWLKRHILSSGKTFAECCEFASQFQNISPWNIHEFYSNNVNGTNDFALLNAGD